VRQDCSFAKKHESPLRFLVLVRGRRLDVILETAPFRAKQYGTFGDYGPAPPDRHPDSRNAIDASA
jgi:hypothetical protein